MSPIPVRIAAIVVAALVVGCIGGDDAGRQREQARAALARFADAVAAAGGGPSVVPVGELTAQVGDWEEKVGGNNKPALMAGLIEAGIGLPPDVPPDAAVTWPDGKSTTVPVLSARQAFDAMRVVPADAQCGECTPMRITAARLTSGPIKTSEARPAVRSGSSRSRAPP